MSVYVSKLIVYLKIFFYYIFSPCKCVCCSKEVYGIPLCKTCMDKYFPVISIHKLCSKCGKLLISEHDVCMECREKTFVTDGLYPLFPYGLWNVELLFLWKMEGYRLLSYVFASFMHERLKELYGLYGPIPLVPVPPRPGKIRKHGWDQIAELCKILKNIYGYEVLDILYRINNQEQKKLNRKDRLNTIGKSYFLKEGVNLPSRLIIVDDIITTGATLQGISQLLKSKGVEKIYGVSIFSGEV